jgi:hypothetical protein
MTRKIMMLSMLLTVLGIGWALVYGTPAGAAGNPSATGHIDILDTSTATSLDHYSFSAIQHKDGSVTGQAEILIMPVGAAGERIHVAVDCLVFFGTDTATVGGTVTEVQVGTAPFNVGDHVAFTVVDNGEGGDSPPDQGSPVTRIADCPLLVTFPSERGNVQVRPGP